MPASTVRLRLPRGYGRYSTNHQIVLDMASSSVVAVGRPVPGNRNDYEAKAMVGPDDHRR